jgi:hydrogenase nickel incorporation protein HypB
MCGTCGCEGGEARLDGEALAHGHAHDHHDHAHPQHTHAPGLSAGRMVRIEQDILAHNNAHAQANRRWLAQRGIFAVNLMSSPGSGKTTLLTGTIERLRGRVEIGVIEGDQQTSQDAERIRATGAKAVQINTGKGCHLEAHVVQQALARLDPAPDSVLVIENVGNLVCPAAFDLGEAHKVVVLSVTEGEDKPLKYPDMFHAASVMLLNKIDLLPHVSFDVGRCVEYARRINPDLRVIELSATRGDGMDEWLAWIEAGARSARRAMLSGLKQRIAEAQAWVSAQGM